MFPVRKSIRVFFSFCCLVLGQSIFISVVSANECATGFAHTLAQIIPAEPVADIEVSTLDLPLSKIDASVLKALKGHASYFGSSSPQDFTYVIDYDDQVFITHHHDALNLPENGAPLIIRSVDEKGVENGTIPREIGNLSWNEKDKKFEFEPKYVQDAAETHKKFSTPEIGKVKYPNQLRSKVLNCMDVVAAQSRQGNFFWNNLMAGTAINAGALGITEANAERHHEGRLRNADGSFNVDGLYSIGNDLSVGLAGTVMGGAAATGLGSLASAVPNGAGMQNFLVKDALIGFGGRQAASQGIVWVNKHYIYQFFGSEKEKSSGELQKNAVAKGNFDRKFYLTKSVWDALAVRGFMNGLPPYLYSSCTQGGALKILLSPSAVRIYEKTGIATLYYTARKKATGE